MSSDTFVHLHDMLEHWSRRTPHAPALIDDHATWGFETLSSAASRACESLRRAGVGAGDRVLIVLENCPQAVAVLFACSRLRAVAVLVNARMSAGEIDAIAAHCDPRVELYAAAGHPDAYGHADRRGAQVQADEGFGPCRIGAGRAANPAPIATPMASGRDDGTDGSEPTVAAMIYTSGSTGQPKGVMLSHRGLLFVAATMARFRALAPQDRSYGVLPMSHAMGLTIVLLSTLLAGGSVRTVARFDPAQLVHALEHEDITLFQGVQAMHASLLTHLRSRPQPLRATRLRFLYAGGAPLDPTLKHDTERLFGLPLHNGYGMTECSPTICHSPFGQWRDDAAVGPPIPGVRVRIVDAKGCDLPDETPGELWVQGPNRMAGYFRDPAATAAVLADGWLRTGDLGRRDRHGDIHLVGRLKDVIVRSGFNVHPAEVEAALNAHPAVALSAVVGRSVAHNEQVVAFVQLRSGMTVDDGELQAFLKDRLSAYKRPADIVVMPSLPVLANGKIRRADLKQLANHPTHARTPMTTQPLTPGRPFPHS